MLIRCFSCKTEKDENEFYRNSFSKTGRQFRCKACDKVWHHERYLRDKDKIREQTRKWNLENKERVTKRSNEWKKNNKDKVRQHQRTSNLRKNFGLEIKDYDEMFNNQNGLCYICKKPETHFRNGVLARLAVDHCHKTGKIRRLLCKSCNQALGLFNENIDTLYSAIEYIKEHK